jgi:hypothetical protein
MTAHSTRVHLTNLGKTHHKASTVTKKERAYTGMTYHKVNKLTMRTTAHITVTMASTTPVAKRLTGTRRRTLPGADDDADESGPREYFPVNINYSLISERI